MKGSDDASLTRARRKLKYLRLSKSTKNSALPIARLPDSILEDIFSRCGPHPVDLLASWKARQGARKDSNSNCFSFEKPWLSYFNLIRFSHVCRRWRAIVRTTGALWSYRAVCSYSNMPSSLVRDLVKKASLRIDLALLSEKTLQPWLRDPKIISRTGTLQAIISTSRAKHFSELIKASPAPALINLTIACSTNNLSSSQEVGLGCTSDAILFADTSPLLRNVCLISVKVPFNSTILRNLTTLCLCNTAIVGHALPDEKHTNIHLDPILDIMSRCPRLETLSLDKTLHYINEVPKVANRVAMPFLRDISIIGAYGGSHDGRAGLHFLSCLELPSVVKLHLGHSPPDAMSVNELIPADLHVQVRDANALAITFSENMACRVVEDVEIKFGVVGGNCLVSEDQYPSQHFSTISSVTYTADRNNCDWDYAWSDLAGITHSFVQRCLGNRQLAVTTLILILQTRSVSRYKKHKSLYLGKLFDFLPHLRVIEVRCEEASSESLRKHESSRLIRSYPMTKPDIEVDDDICNEYVNVWDLGAEVAEALHSAVLDAEKENENLVSLLESEDPSPKTGRVVLPRLTRLVFVGAYFNKASNNVQLNRKKSWLPGQAFEDLLTFVEHRSRNSEETAGSTDSGALSSSSGSSADLSQRTGTVPCIQFSDCFGIHDEWLDKLLARCGSILMSPYALPRTRARAKAFEWDLRNPWFSLNGIPLEDSEEENEIEGSRTTNSVGSKISDVSSPGSNEGSKETDVCDGVATLNISS